MSNALRIAYPQTRSMPAQVFGPALDPRTYLRAAHLLLMFPLGIAYFVSLLTLLAFGGSLIWTFPGAAVVLATIFGSRLVGDMESFIVSRVTDIEIRRPPWMTEGTEGWRSRLWTRLIDPTTWTGILYLFGQFPIGLAAFVSLVVAGTVSGAFVASPLIIHFTGEPIQLDIGSWSYEVDRPLEALWLMPIGLVAFLLTVHMVTVFSVLHATWARFMLGSRARPVSSSLLPQEPGGPGPDLPTATIPGAGRNAPDAVLSTSDVRSPDWPVLDRRSPASLTDDLTQREREVFLLMARGMTNSEIAEECFISQGTVKTHVKRILAKLKLNDRTQVVVYAYETGLVSPEATQRTQTVAR